MKPQRHDRLRTQIDNLLDTVGDCLSIVEVLRWRSARHPDRIAFTYLQDGETEQESITFAELQQRALLWACSLREVCNPGDRAILLYPPGLEFISALFGCLYANVIAVPAYPPRRNRPESRSQAILRSAQPRVALTTRSLRTTVEQQLADVAEKISVLTLDAGPGEELDHRKLPVIDSRSPAFLQYTSGSTSIPKGVVVSHANLMHNQRAIQLAMEHDENSTFVGWLPMYHDMGLVGNLFQPLFIGARCVLMSPVAFLQKPSRWLHAISRYRGVTSGGPNFGYELCVRKISAEERIGLDLSSWRVAFNGAEPVRYDTLERFTRAFSASGFRHQTFYPCYGLAEATLMVSGVSVDDPPLVRHLDPGALGEGRVVEAGVDSERTVPAVSCGKALLDGDIRIVNPETSEQAAQGEVGEIWASNPGIASGYWNRPEETAETFAGTIGEQRFLRTGDLGFIDENNLFIVGRLKDLIIIRGRNYYPQDLELVAERSHPDLRIGCGAVFTMEERGEQSLTVVYEVDRHHVAASEDIAEAIRRAIFTEYDLPVQTVALIQTATIPKTTSGKIRRSACRAALLDGSLQLVARSILPDIGLSDPEGIEAISAELSRKAEFSSPSATRIQRLQAMVARILNLQIAQCGIDRPLISLGISSLTAAELERAIEVEFAVRVSTVDVLESESIAALAERLTQDAGSQQTPVLRRLIGHTDVSIEQNRLWLLQRINPRNALTISASFRVHGDLDAGVLQRSLNKLINKYEVLRTGYPERDGLSSAVVHEDAPVPVITTDLRAFGAESQRTLAREFQTTQTDVSFDLARPPLLRVGVLRLQDRLSLLVIVMHHIVGDARSLEILAREMVFDSEGPAGQPIQFSDYATWQKEYLFTEAFAHGVEYWSHLLRDLRPLKFPFELPTSTSASQPRRVSLSLPDEIKQLLDNSSQHENTTVFVVLAATLQFVLHRLTSQQDITIAFPILGRDLPEIQDAVGLFAYPLLLRTDLSGNPTFSELVGRVRRGVLDAMRHRSVPFSRIAQAASAGRPDAPVFRVMLSYIETSLPPAHAGDLDLESTDAMFGPRDCDLALTVCANRGHISAELCYDSTRFHQDTGQWIGHCYASALGSALRHPNQNIESLILPALADIDRPASKHPPLRLRLSATFTADPIVESLQFWIKETGIESALTVAPVGQIFQSVLQPSLPSDGGRECNVLLVRLGDWQGRGNSFLEPDKRAAAVREVESNCAELVELLRKTSSIRQTIVVLCPESPALQGDMFIHAQQQRVLEELRSIDGLRVIASSEAVLRHGVMRVCDEHTDREVSIPYTLEAYAALGTAVARTLYQMSAKPKKVIVVDCDDTLWCGVCSEDGAAGVQLNAAERLLQQLLVDRHDAGMLICLCSKNDPQDVFRTLATRLDMSLRHEHIVASRINWLSKTENLLDLSRQLNIGLDSFVMIDNDQMECAEIRARLPEVLVIEFSQQFREKPSLLEHIWDLDASFVTATGMQRTELYRQEFARKTAVEELSSIEDFLKTLQLEVEFQPAGPGNIERIAELTRRTNQFNMSRVRRFGEELSEALEQRKIECIAVSVRDRFGDYGLVGTILYSIQDGVANVDTFLLSCRALGRGIEHRILRKLAEDVTARQAVEIRIPFTRTEQNTPAHEFLDEVARNSSVSALFDGAVYRFRAIPLLSLVYVPNGMPAALSSPRMGATPARSDHHGRAGGNYGANHLVETTIHFSDCKLLVQHLHQSQFPLDGKPLDNQPHTEYVAPRNPVENQLAAMWSELLGMSRIGINDDFFSLGGHSLLAMQVLSQVEAVFGLQLPVAEVFQNVFTIASLAQTIENYQFLAVTPGDLARHLEEIDDISDEEASMRLTIEAKLS